MKDNIFGNMEFLESLSKKFEEQERIMEPLRLAAKQLEFSGIAQYANLTSAVSTQQIGAVGSAYLSGAYQFENTLAQKLHDIYAPLEKVLDNITTIEKLLGTRFQELVQPSLYLPDRSGLHIAVDSFSSALSSTVSAIDTSWAQQVNPWLTKVSRFNALDTSTLIGVNTEFSKLIKLEQETSGLALIANRFSEITSAAAQLASIEKSLVGIAEQWRDVIAPLQFLDNYSSFASRQHTLIQKAVSANDDKSVEWRLDLLDATSRFVDRQITWASDFAVDIQEDIDSKNLPVIESELDIAAIPQYIGYSKRDDKVVDEALAESGIAIITEKGKLIVSKARLIQKFCRANNSELLFENTDLYVGSYVTLAGTFCRNIGSLESVVDALYHLFYSQRESLSVLINLDDFECIEQIRNLKDKGNYPERSKEISDLQNRLYDRFLKLEDAIIEKLETDSSSGRPTVSATTMLSEDNWTEETMSKNIFKALLKVQGNKTFCGKKEDELNDCVRDVLSMVYEMKDQTRQGTSPSGKDAGEVDLQICRDGFPIAMIEGLKVNSVDRNYIQTHIDKVLTCYDPFGCPYTYIVIYAKVKKFADFWTNCLNLIREEYSFPYTIKEEIQELNHMYASSRHAKIVLLRDDREVAVHFYALSVQ
ncbi:MAG: hypothetical protein K2N01_02855 [Lachnospiraceae bacterium]|nr:hypothetical protein [Lachnospiraceae bacterium]